MCKINSDQHVKPSSVYIRTSTGFSTIDGSHPISSGSIPQIRTKLIQLFWQKLHIIFILTKITNLLIYKFYVKNYKILHTIFFFLEKIANFLMTILHKSPIHLRNFWVIIKMSKCVIIIHSIHFNCMIINL